MNRDQTNIFNMFITVKSFLDGTVNVWSKAIPFVNIKYSFDNVINSIYPLVIEFNSMRIEKETDDLSLKISQAALILEKLDSMSERFLQDVPEFVINYQKARMIADYQCIGTFGGDAAQSSKVA